jgi:hypothetical protein
MAEWGSCDDEEDELTALSFIYSFSLEFGLYVVDYATGTGQPRHVSDG